MFNTGRFRSICSITFLADNAKILHEKLKNILTKFSIEEFKWNKCNGDSKYRECAKNFIDWSLENLDNINIDIIIWDIQDSRHKIENRDDDKNFSMMYSKLLHYRISNMIPNSWYELYPDEKSGFNWNRLENYLSYWNDIYDDGAIEISHGSVHINPNKMRSTIRKIRPIDSKKSIFNQLADFWAGLAVFSYNNYKLYKIWLDNENGQLSFFPQKIEISKSQKTRFSILRYFDGHKNKPHNIVINNQGLKTCLIKNHNINLNFWLYTPQTYKDKAPIKQ